MLKKFINSIMIPKRIALSSLMVITCVIVLSGILMIEIPLLQTAKDTTDFTGNTLGKATGLAVGSLKALSEMQETINKAKQQASKGEITNARIQGDFNTICNLELLTTDITVHYSWEYGKEGSPSYAALYVLNGTGVFLTDLSKADVSIIGNTVYVTLNEPSLKVYFDGKPTQIAEYTKDFANPFQNVEAANEGYLNQRKEAIERVKTEMVGYEGLLSRAKISAEKNIIDIVGSVYGMNAVISFKGEGEVYEGQ